MSINENYAFRLNRKPYGWYMPYDEYTKNVVQICGVIWINKTYGGFISRQKHNTSDNYSFRDAYESDKWANVKINPVKTENIKTEENVRTKHDYRAEEDVYNNTKTISSKIYN